MITEFDLEDDKIEKCSILEPVNITLRILDPGKEKETVSSRL